MSRINVQNAQNRPTLPSLTGMRFVAALMVFSLAVAFYLFDQPNAVAMDVTWQLAAAGVSFFFILSGFILAWSAPARETARRFWRRRFFKIYPNHLITFVAAILILTLVAGGTVGNWLPNVLLVHSFSPDLEVRGGFNGVAWTLSCEAAFYFSFPLLMRAVNRIRRERLLAWAGGVVAAIFAVPILAAATAPADQFLMDGVSAWGTYIVYQFPLTRMLEFVFGILLARLVMSGQRRWLSLGRSVVLVLAAFAVTPLVPSSYAIVAVMVVPLGLLIVAGAVTDVEKRPTPLSSRAMVWLGDISFAFYMWHYLILLCGYYWLVAGNGLSAPVIVAIATGLLGVTVVVSWLQFALVERPIMRRFARPRRPRLVAVRPSAHGTAWVDQTEEPDRAAS